MDSLVEPPVPGTPKFTLLEKENERLKRNLAYYEKALAQSAMCSVANVGNSNLIIYGSMIDKNVTLATIPISMRAATEMMTLDGTGEDNEDDVTDGTRR